ncbi:uncharacterized protein [Ptychodera flava]|uniref:uncharacterized protein n=1 Tax=Ptychodera flava TaxID=63121 RepID=UPI00396A7092
MASSSRHESDSRDQNLTDNGAKTDPQDVITKIDGDDDDELSKTGIDRDRRRRSNTSGITSMDNKNRGDSRSTSLNRVSGDAQAGSLGTGSPGPVLESPDQIRKDKNNRSVKEHPEVQPMHTQKLSPRVS